VNTSHRWALVILVSSLAALLATDVASGTPLTTVPLLWFLAVCPGMPYARLVTSPGTDWVQRWMTAVGLSLGLGAVVAEILLYTGAFTGFTAVAVLGAIAILGALVEQWRSATAASAETGEMSPAEPTGSPSTTA
jgi:hypothetical protein